MRYLNSILLLIFFCTISFLSCSADQSNNSTDTNNTIQKEPAKIEVQINGYTSGRANLVGYFTGQQYLVDSTYIQSDGKFVFESADGYKPGMVFIMMPDSKYFPILLDKDQKFVLKTDKLDIQNKMQVEGSIDNQLYYDNVRFEANYQKELKALKDKMAKVRVTEEAYQKLLDQQDALVLKRKNTLNQVFADYPTSFYTAFKYAGQNPDVIDFKTPSGDLDTVKQIYTYRKQFWDNVNLQDERLLYTPVITNKLKRYITELTAQNPDSIITSADQLIAKVEDQQEYFKYFVNWIALHYDPSEATIMDADAVYAHMIQQYFTNEKAFWSNEYEIEHLQRKASEMAVSLIGMQGSDVKAKNPAGQMKSIFELSADYIVIFMYSPSCDHCIEESPKMVQFYKKWKNKGIDVFGIGTDTDDAEWKKFVQEQGMNIFTNVYDPTNRAIYKKYYVDITPEIYILNKDRKIIGKNLNVDQIETIIDRDKKK